MIRKQILLSIILLLFIFNIDIVISSILSSTHLFYTKVFVTVFPFTILSEILIYYNYHIFLSKTIGKFISKIFNISEESTIVFILSILTSQPSNSVYLKNLLDNKIINTSEANKLLTFTYFPSISFLIGTVGIGIFRSANIGLILLITNYINNILIGLFLRKEKYYSIYKKQINNNTNFFNMIKNGINKGFNTCMIILGNTIIFTIILNIIKNYINLSPITFSIVFSLLDLISGVNNIGLLNIGINYKICLMSFALNFSSLSILFQSKSILSDYNINIKKTLIIKLVFSIITSIILLIIINIH